MKKLFCILFALLLLVSAASAEASYESVRVEFDAGFSLDLPADWVSYEVPAELTDDGFIYCLGSADGQRLMYVQRWDMVFTDLSALHSVLSQRPEIVLRTDTATADGSFLLYNFVDGDCSGCATLVNNTPINLLFLPQSDADYMLIAASILSSAN